MPVMNGHEATRAIRKIEASRKNSVDVPVVPPPGSPIKLPSPRVVQSRVKIFALTGLATTDDKREAFGSGVDGYLVSIDVESDFWPVRPDLACPCSYTHFETRARDSLETLV
jgi:CheY-like chemotaxis protein